MNMPKAGLTMAGQLHLLITRLATETVSMAGGFMSSDAFWCIPVYSNPLVF